MCDTMVATGRSVAEIGTLFAKNSDREPGEAQFLEFVPRRHYRSGSTVKLTYIEVPQVAETHAVLLSKPFWIWGAEMGANDRGVAIGNEAVYAKVPPGRRPALIGMDLLRLGLERGDSARHALDTMIALLERHGQGGSCGHRRRRFYDNSFIVADADEAFVFETFGREWAVERVGGIRTISNALSIGTSYERISAGAADLARDMGWTAGNGKLDFTETFANVARDKISQGRARCARSTEVLRSRNAPLNASDMMTAVRDHGAGNGPGSGWRPDRGFDKSICMHASAPARRGQTTGSMVSVLCAGRTVHWLTGSAAPCTGLFKPVLMEHGLPDRRPKANDRYNPRARWWRHERLHRAILADFPARLAAIAAERDALEATFVARIDEVLSDDGRGAAARRAKAVAACWDEADAAEDRWLREVSALPVREPADVGYRRGWRRLNRLAGWRPAA
jgi:dipeptidase